MADRRSPVANRLVICAIIGKREIKRAMRRVNLILGEARRALSLTQKEFGRAVGASHRTAVRWDARQSSPAEHNLRTLAGLLYPQYRELAAEVAEALGTTLVGLGLEVP